MSEKSGSKEPIGFDSSDLNQLVRDFLAEQSRWMEAEERLKSILLEVAAGGGVVATRRKALYSLVDKAHRHGRYRLEDFADLLGGRVVVPLRDDLLGVEDRLREAEGVTILKVDEKVLGPTELGYQGRHFDLSLEPGDGWPNFDRPTTCEVQVRTAAQDLWSVLSHQVAYKVDLPADIQREVNRLGVLTELFDKEISEASAKASHHRDPSAELEESVRQLFAGIAGGRSLEIRSSSSLFSLAVPPSIPPGEYREQVQNFVVDFAVELGALFTTNHGLDILEYQESILVLEQIQSAPTDLRERWSEVFPSEQLDELSNLWGSWI